MTIGTSSRFGREDRSNVLLVSLAIKKFDNQLFKQETKMTDKIREQILAIRATGLTNMFDKNMVQRLAFERDMYELVMFLEDEPKEYVKFIMYGDDALSTT